MQTLHNLGVLCQLATDHETELRRTTMRVADGHTERHLRRWLGRRLVRVGAWVAAEPTLRPVTAR